MGEIYPNGLQPFVFSSLCCFLWLRVVPIGSAVSPFRCGHAHSVLSFFPICRFASPTEPAHVATPTLTWPRPPPHQQCRRAPPGGAIAQRLRGPAPAVNDRARQPPRRARPDATAMAFTFAAFCYMLALLLTAALIFFAIWHVSEGGEKGEGRGEPPGSARGLEPLHSVAWGSSARPGGNGGDGMEGMGAFGALEAIGK